jgi:phenylpyruvate tautomerase PptA (4-oxalocrotonate tautomerase family)
VACQGSKLTGKLRTQSRRGTGDEGGATLIVNDGFMVPIRPSRNLLKDLTRVLVEHICLDPTETAVVVELDPNIEAERWESPVQRESPALRRVANRRTGSPSPAAW